MTTLNLQPLISKRVLLFSGPDFEDSELLYPWMRFQEAGATVKVAGLGAKEYTGKKGYPIPTDGSYEDFVVGHWDMVVIPGGWAPDKIRMNAAALEIVRKAAKAGNAIGAICHGGWVLASADVIQGKKVTSYIAIKDDMVNAGGHWVDEAVVNDCGIITSRTPADLPDFCRALITQVVQAPVLV